MGLVKWFLEEIASEMGTEDISDPEVMAEGQKRLAHLLARDIEEEERQTEALLDYFGGVAVPTPDRKRCKRCKTNYDVEESCCPNCPETEYYLVKVFRLPVRKRG